jgi:hypothetical protein
MLNSPRSMAPRFERSRPISRGRDEKQLERVRADLSEYGQVGVG